MPRCEKLFLYENLKMRIEVETDDEKVCKVLENAEDVFVATDDTAMIMMMGDREFVNIMKMSASLMNNIFREFKDRMSQS
ncbi:hypothetical protein DRN86_03615 [Candidatus Geothermarchaeota archaeon]|nr:MAG: hypothetical protein DRN86_03615 [Candidatus Geothermarchaeota archaeon]